jgi:hypothetical protein
MLGFWANLAWVAMTAATECAIAAKGDWSSLVGRLTTLGVMLAALGAALKSPPGTP